VVRPRRAAGRAVTDNVDVVDYLEMQLEDARRDLNVRNDEYETALNAIEDLNVQCKFWRQAAEHAVKGWNALEDRVEAAKEALRAIEHNTDAVRELLGGAEEWAPPPDIVSKIDFASITKDPSSPGFPRLVEDETPVKEEK
jgi:hypothetical protein